MNIIQNRKKWIDKYKVAKGCEICGYNKHPAALCFDHLPGTEKAEAVKNGYSKRSTAGGMYKMYSPKYTVKQLIDEIRKCRILCCNCHMEHTHSKRASNLNPDGQESVCKTDDKQFNPADAFSIIMIGGEVLTTDDRSAPFFV